MEEQASQPGGTTLGARCALHPIQPATSVCGRCGNYMCITCTEGGQQSLCPPCRQRTGQGAFPFDRQRFDLGDVITFSFERFKEQWLVPSLGILLVWVVSIAFSMVDGGVQLGLGALQGEPGPAAIAVSVFLNVLSWIVQTGMQLGIMGACLNIAQGGKAEPGDLFGQFARLPHALAQYLVLMTPFGLLVGVPVGIAIGFGFSPDSSAIVPIALGLGALVFLPIFIYVVLGLSFMQIELVQDPDVGPLEAMGRSWRIASGKRLWLLVLWFVVFALTFAGLVACCVGVIPAAGLSSLIMAGVYLALRTGADL